MHRGYVHGYDDAERQRLEVQAATLAELLWADTVFEPGETVLEAGCGVGAQTLTLARRHPRTRFVAVDRSWTSLETARRRIEAAGLANVTLQQLDFDAQELPSATVDHVVVCFVLEHLPVPAQSLQRLRRVLKPGGVLTVIEGDHGSTLFAPESDPAWAVIDCLVELQRRVGGDALIGRTLHRLLVDAGYTNPKVSPRTVYADPSRPAWVEGFTRGTFIAMVEGVADAAVAAGLLTAAEFQHGLERLRLAAGPHGMFGYTFFKGVARAP
jgi:SAM-dependent methyltransferase